MGRSRGGLSTKIHQLVDGHGRPLVVLVGPGQAGDAPMFGHLMNHLRIARVGPRSSPDPPRAYRGRNVVERGFCDVKQWRGLVTRYDKLALTYRGGVVLKAIITWLRALGDTP